MKFPDGKDAVMKKNWLFALWGGLFILCAGLGFIPEPEGTVKGLMTVLSVLFFLPGGILLHEAQKGKNRKQIRIIRNLSAASLGLTAAVLVLNFLCFAADDAVGDGLYAVLVIVSSPMVCSGYWLLSLFLWACLLVKSVDLLKTTK